MLYGLVSTVLFLGDKRARNMEFAQELCNSLITLKYL